MNNIIELNQNETSCVHGAGVASLVGYIYSTALGCGVGGIVGNTVARFVSVFVTPNALIGFNRFATGGRVFYGAGSNAHKYVNSILYFAIIVRSAFEGMLLGYKAYAMLEAYLAGGDS